MGVAASPQGAMMMTQEIKGNDGVQGSPISQLTFLLDSRTLLFVDQNTEPPLTSAGNSQATKMQATALGWKPLETTETM